MREREFMIPPTEESDDDSSEETTEKKSNKKTKFERALDFLLPRKSTKDPEHGEQEKSGFFEKSLERAKGSIGRLLGIEKSELPEEENSRAELTEEGYEPYTPWFRFGNIQLQPAEVEESSGVVIDEGEADRRALDAEATPQGVLGLDTEPATDEPSADSPSRNSPGDSVDIAVETPLQARQEQAEHGDKNQDQPAETAEQTSRLMTETAVNENTSTEKQPEQTRQQTVVEQRGGAGAALVGFVAAETLSRHRDKKIRKHAKQMDQQIRRQGKEIENQAQELRILQRRQDEQREQLQQKRSQSQEILNKPTPKGSEIPETIREAVGSQIEKLQETVSDKKTEPQDTDIEQPPSFAEKSSEREELPSREPTREKIKTDVLREAANSVDQKERLHLEQIERAADQDIALESFYEKRHETKDEPSAHTEGGSRYAVKDLTGDHNASPTAIGSQEPRQQVKFVQRPYLQDKEYREAAKQGALAGVVVIIAIALILFIRGLL